MQIRRTSDLVWRVSGDLTLHGTTRPAIAEVTRQDDAYVGTARIKQTEFGIRLIKIGGGVVKVMDELDISIRLYTVPLIQP
jgi:polyisoprenoid-binding protein YceI